MLCLWLPTFRCGIRLSKEHFPRNTGTRSTDTNYRGPIFFKFSVWKWTKFYSASKEPNVKKMKMSIEKPSFSVKLAFQASLNIIFLVYIFFKYIKYWKTTNTDSTLSMSTLSDIRENLLKIWTSNLHCLNDHQSPLWGRKKFHVREK